MSVDIPIFPPHDRGGLAAGPVLRGENVQAACVGMPRRCDEAERRECSRELVGVGPRTGLIVYLLCPHFSLLALPVSDTLPLPPKLVENPTERGCSLPQKGRLVGTSHPLSRDVWLKAQALFLLKLRWRTV